MADGTTMARVREIVKSDSSRRFLVVSAPGKRYGGEQKVTDLLYLAHAQLMASGSLGEPFEKVKRRFLGIVGELGLDSFDMETLLQETEQEILKQRKEAFTVSRGEYLSAKLFAAFLELPFVDPSEVIRFSRDGKLLTEQTYALTQAALNGKTGAVLAGFYGVNERGEIQTFSRGGGDISGAIVARAVGADVYENWTDVSGFLVCDPRIVENPSKINALTFQELTELSRMGASVLHTESIYPVCEADIPVRIKNTFRPQDDGTLIIPTSKYRGNCPVTGIAGKKNYTALSLENPKMGGVEPLERVLQALRQNNSFCEYVFSENDKTLLVFDEAQAKKGNALKIIEQTEAFGQVKIIKNLALIAIVGQGLKGSVGATARIFKAISQAGVNIKVISCGASELKLLLGVDGEDYERTIRAIYDEFYKEW